MFDKIKKIFYRLTNFTLSHDPVTSVYRPEIFQEDTRSIQSIKNVRKAFEEQSQDIQTRALKRHAHDCLNVFNCTKPSCWKFEPDRIVKESVASDEEQKKHFDRIKKNQEVLKEVKSPRRRKSST